MIRTQTIIFQFDVGFLNTSAAAGRGFVRNAVMKFRQVDNIAGHTTSGLQRKPSFVQRKQSKDSFLLSNFHDQLPFSVQREPSCVQGEGCTNSSAGQDATACLETTTTSTTTTTTTTATTTTAAAGAAAPDAGGVDK